MTRRGDWRRVNKAERCPICERPDWCLVTGPVGDPTAVICARTKSDKRAGEAGWLHRLRAADDSLRQQRRRAIRTVPLKPAEKPVRDFGGFARQCHQSTTPDALRQTAESLGLSVESLRRLLVGWSYRHRAWTFPMQNAAGDVTGIRLRLPNGLKLSVKGGREGLFLPDDLQPAGTLLIAEGPSDTAALLDLGFDTIGRPSCTGGTKHLCELARRLQLTDAVIVADADTPGQRGADNLASTLAAYVPAVRVIAPPNRFKDARSWKRAGATAADVVAAIEVAPVRRLSVTIKGS